MGSIAVVGRVPPDYHYLAYLLNVQSFGNVVKVDDPAEILS